MIEGESFWNPYPRYFLMRRFLSVAVFKPQAEFMRKKIPGGGNVPREMGNREYHP